MLRFFERAAGASVCAALAMLAGGARADVVIGQVVIGQSAGGLDLVVQVVADPGPDGLGRSPDERPALAIIAGLDARHGVGVTVARGVAERLVREHGAALADRTVYVLALANPDGASLVASGRFPAADFGLAPRDMDADRDGRVNEDPAEDLNGDGLITMMRVPSPGPSTGLKTTVTPDPEDERLMRAPEAEKGEIATHALVIEGLDNDRDGAFNEDGYAGSAGGGVSLDRNFPSFWPDLAVDAGLHPLSEPETVAIVRWLQSRPNVQAVLVYGPGDNLRNAPAAKQMDESGRMPKGLEEGDKPHFDRMAEKYKELLGEGAAGKAEIEGTLTSWAYSDLGVWSLRSSVWARPKVEDKKDGDKKEEEKKDEAAAPASEREALLARGVDPIMVDFITADEAKRKAMIADFEASSPDAQAEMLLAMERAPEDIRNRVLAIAQGLPDPGAAAPGEPAEAAAEPVPAASGPAKKKGKPKESDASAWLAYLDAARGGEGFVPWQTFSHPQLGRVEIGGFVPGVTLNPPEAEVEGLVSSHAAFAADVLGRLADVRVGSPVVEKVGDGLYRVTLSVMNPGGLPTSTAIAEKTRRLAPVVVEIGVDPSRLVSGTRAVGMDPIPGGGTAHAEWLLRAKTGEALKIVVRSAMYGDREIEVGVGR